MCLFTSDCEMYNGTCMSMCFYSFPCPHLDLKGKMKSYSCLIQFFGTSDTPHLCGAYFSIYLSVHFLFLLFGLE